MKKIISAIFFLILLFLIGCSNEDITSTITTQSTTMTISDNITPLIEVSPAGGYFVDTEQVHIQILSVSDIISRVVDIDGIETDLTDTNSYITIGDSNEVGETINIIVKAENSFGETISMEYSFTKVLPFVDAPLEKVDEYNNLRIYQIYVAAYMDGNPGGYTVGYGPSSHQGDLVGITNSLGYIDSLGVNAIWLTPIFESKDDISLDQWEERGRTTGYFADDYYNIDPNFGTNEQFRTLVEEAHDRGIYVFLDGVFGHHGYYDIEGVTDGNSQWYGHETLYPESLDFYKDVATYWIDEYEIDGWRLDQSYQLYQDSYNYCKDIRKAVEEISFYREVAGEEWGVLGYIVGEVWDNASNIEYYGYANDSLRSAFNFPVRYALVRALAVDENDNHSSLSYLDLEMDYQYSNYAQPNMFITNHDLIRFGDLLQFADLDDQYWQRYKMAFSFLAAYTGPITIYYGDEYGDEYSVLVNDKYDIDSLPYIAPDNVARSPGFISGFTTEQQNLIDYVATIMEIRDENSCLWNGERTNLMVTDSVYLDLKSDSFGSIVYALNISSETNTVYLDSDDVGGVKLTNIITGEVITSVGGVFTINLLDLSGTFFKVE
jgi:hypothetical protein